MSMLGSWSPFPDVRTSTSIQVAFLGGVYSFAFKQAVELLAGGSEMMLLVPPLASAFGAVLPVLAALPECALVLFAGLGGQEQLPVGMGVLGGSTVMLLSLPWCAAIVSGRVTMRKGELCYEPPNGVKAEGWDKLETATRWSLVQTGVGFDASLGSTSKLMMATLLGFAAVEASRVAGVPPAGAQLLPLVASTICGIGLVYFLSLRRDEAHQPEGPLDDHIADACAVAIREGRLTLRGAVASLRERNWKSVCANDDVEQSLLNRESIAEVRRLCSVLSPFFDHADADSDGRIDFEEFRLLFRDLGENVHRAVLDKLFQNADCHASGSVSFEDVVACALSFAVDPTGEVTDMGSPRRYSSRRQGVLLEVESPSCPVPGNEDPAEFEDVAKAYAGLLPSEQLRRTRTIALGKLVSGMILLLAFAGPVVDTLGEISGRMKVSPFYAAFLFAPLCTGACGEVAAASQLAARRTRRSMTAVFTTLQQAVVVNNTLTLGVLSLAVYCRDLQWEFSAETLVVVSVVLCVAALTVDQDRLTLQHGFQIAGLYPAALISVILLRNFAGLT